MCFFFFLKTMKTKVVFDSHYQGPGKGLQLVQVSIWRPGFVHPQDSLICVVGTGVLCLFTQEVFACLHAFY